MCHKIIKIISCILQDCIGTKLQSNSRRNYKNYTNIWRLNNILLNEQISGEIREEILKSLQKLLKMKAQLTRTFGVQLSSFKEKIGGYESLHLKRPYILNKQLSGILQNLRKEEQVKPQSNRHWEMVMSRAEINEIDTKRILNRNNQTKGSSVER